MPRVVANSFLTALVLVALFWGNCLTCPQLLLLMAQQNSSHACCHRSAHQEAPASPVSKNCQSVGLKNFLKSDPGKLNMPALSAALLPAAPATAPLPPSPASSETPAHHSPPDLLALHSVLRV